MAVSATVLSSEKIRRGIYIVGSSTVYPFAAYISERLAATTDHAMPMLVSTGSGSGLKLFVQGTGRQYPEIVNCSRRMKVHELEIANQNHCGPIIELGFGYDGVVIGHNKNAVKSNLTLRHLLFALAEKIPNGEELMDNPYQKWSDIDPKLPDKEILIYGPPDTSGTFDALLELIMENASSQILTYGGKYNNIRTDGHYVPSGEDDTLIIRKIMNDSHAFGIFGYGFLKQNKDYIQAASIEGIAPDEKSIENGQYPLSRVLYLYIKSNRIDKIPGLTDYVDLFLSDEMIGEKAA